MKVLLINPPYARLRGSGQSAYFPLGLGYLAGTLASGGFDPVIYSAENCPPGERLPKTGQREVFELRAEGHRNYVAALRNDEHPVWREVRQTLAETRPDVVGITSLSVQFGAAAKIAEIVKRWRPECPVVLGGHHVTYLPADSLRQAPAVDVAVVGEGEETFLELCRAYARDGRPDFASIPGLACRAGDGAVLSEPRALHEDLDLIPHPRRDLLLFPERHHPSDFASLIYGRGCPWRCRFCSSKLFWRRRTRMRSPENCLEEIRGIMGRFGVSQLVFWDDAFSVNRKVIASFCESAIRSNLGFTFRTATRADLAVDEDLIALMKRAGCVELTLGVESGSPRVLEMIRKDLDLDVLRRAIALIRKHGIAVGTFFMAGFPRETVEDLGQTFRLIRELKVNRTAFNIFDPMPGSELYDEAIELGLVRPNADWRDFPLWPDRHFVTAMSREEFDLLARRIASYVFRRDDSLIARLRRHWPLLRRNPRALLGKALRALLR